MVIPHMIIPKESESPREHLNQRFPKVSMPMRPSNRTPAQLRSVRITRNYTRHAEGSVLIECGDTRILCTASLDEKVPPFLRGRG